MLMGDELAQMVFTDALCAGDSLNKVPLPSGMGAFLLPQIAFRRAIAPRWRPLGLTVRLKLARSTSTKPNR